MSKVLFVDDDTNILGAIRRSLRGRIELDTALGGAEALSMLSEGRHYAVVVTDMRMPDMDGITLLAHFKQLSPETVRMVLSGNADPLAPPPDAAQTGIFRYLAKPCAHDKLLGAVAEALDHYHRAAG
jgi:DNA-binding NtrC family response regulator